MAARPLDDQEVLSEMNKMVAFIKQEALEKAREIKVKADEEFNIEKAKIVRQESLNIEAVFERKTKQAEVQKRIAQSNHINKARLRVLQERQQVLDSLFDEARALIQDVSSDQDKYASVVEKLVLQGAYSLMEPEISVQCREADLDIVNFAAERVSQTYQEKFQKPMNISVSEEYLPASSAGGVIMSGLGGKITVDNTLETRLALCKSEMLPQLRVTLFGNSPNRKFFN